MNGTRILATVAVAVFATSAFAHPERSQDTAGQERADTARTEQGRDAMQQDRARQDRAGQGTRAEGQQRMGQERMGQQTMGQDRMGKDHMGKDHMGRNAMQHGHADPAQVERMTQGWPEASRKAIEHMTRTYGPPAAVTDEMAVWGRTGPWKRTIVFRTEVPHRFPMPHMDVMQQWVDYKAPPAMYDELAIYDGSVVLERTAGEMSARCDKEGANFLAVNLADEIVTGKRSVEDARKKYGEQIKAMMAGEPAPYTERIMFSTSGKTIDPGTPLAGM